MKELSSSRGPTCVSEKVFHVTLSSYYSTGSCTCASVHRDRHRCSVALSDRYILLKQDQAEPKTPPDSESFSEVKMEKWVGLQSEGEQGKALIRLGVKKEEGERGRGSI